MRKWEGGKEGSWDMERLRSWEKLDIGWRSYNAKGIALKDGSHISN
jgi:hypothetical protein